jgi:hypothetical protein
LRISLADAFYLLIYPRLKARQLLALYKKLKARFAPSSLMVFVSNPFEPNTLFIKCVHALNLTGQLKLFHIYPVNMVNSKKEYPENAASY